MTCVVLALSVDTATCTLPCVAAAKAMRSVLNRLTNDEKLICRADVVHVCNSMVMDIYAIVEAAKHFHTMAMLVVAAVRRPCSLQTFRYDSVPAHVVRTCVGANAVAVHCSYRMYVV